MKFGRGHRVAAFTLLEVSLVAAILVLLASMAVPTLIREIRADALPRSARQLRSVLSLVAAHAALEGKRYQIRFPREDEEEENLLIDDRQPIIEREDDPIRHPEEFVLVTEPWVVGRTFLDKVWCARVRLGKPTIELLRQERDAVAEGLDRAVEEELEDFDVQRPPLVFEPDGTSRWATFVVTDAPSDIDIGDLVEYATIEVILEAETGLAWLQRPFSDSEIDLFEERGWPAVLRQDFLDSRELTEDDVLEIRESSLRGYDVKRKGQELEATGAGANGETP